MYSITPTIDENYILSRVTQEEIFERYLGVQVRYGELFCSPLRSDKHPTCTFWKSPDGYLLFRDWSEETPFSVFSLTMRMFNLNYYAALQQIYIDFIKGSAEIPTIKFTPKKVNTVKLKKNIQVGFTKWHKEQIEYLKQYHLDSSLCAKFNVFPIDTVYLEGKIFYKYDSSDPAIAYYFGKNGNEQRWKIYFFKRKQYRFLCNTNRINGWIQLPEKGPLLVITKSLKDVMALSMFDIPAIAMQNETTMPYDYIIEELQSRFEQIVSLYDYDRTGIHLADRLKESYGIPSFFFKNVPGVKDFSDYLKLNGKQKTQRLVNYVKTSKKILI
jgi:hypothetical protein